MTTEYTQSIKNLPAYSEVDGNADVVFSVSWALTGTDGAFSASWDISTQVPYVAGQPFTPYADLTEAEVNSWIATYTPTEIIDRAKGYIQKSIDTQQTVTTPALPWAPPPMPAPTEPAPTEPAPTEPTPAPV